MIELSHQLLQTRDIAKSIPGTQLNWTVAQAGLVRNQIPERAIATGDMRLTIPDRFERVEAVLVERVKTKLIPDAETTITIERGCPPFVASPAAREPAKVGVVSTGPADKHSSPCVRAAARARCKQRNAMQYNTTCSR